MMKLICFLVLSLLGVGVAADETFAQGADGPTDAAEFLVEFEPGKQVANSIEVVNSDGEKRQLGYWLYVPENYKDIDSHPCMMFLHGMGERGDDLSLVKKWGPPRLIDEGNSMPFIVISPQCPGDITWKTTHLEQVLDAVIGRTKVDQQRVYVTGLSMGGYGTWSLLAECPERIAAAIPICGGGDPETASKIGSVPIWAFHGDADTVVSVERGRQMVDAVRNAGGKVDFTIYQGVGHNSWTATYANSKVYDWLLKHRKIESNSTD